MSRMVLKIIEPKRKYAPEAMQIRRRSESGRLERVIVPQWEIEMQSTFLEMVANALTADYVAIKLKRRIAPSFVEGMRAQDANSVFKIDMDQGQVRQAHIVAHSCCFSLEGEDGDGYPASLRSLRFIQDMVVNEDMLDDADTILKGITWWNRKHVEWQETIVERKISRRKSSLVLPRKLSSVKSSGRKAKGQRSACYPHNPQLSLEARCKYAYP